MLLEPSQSASAPLRERPRDWFFIAVFTCFACSSFFLDAVNLVARPDAGSVHFLPRLVHEYYAVGADPLLIANPRFVQIGTGISALLFGPFYLVMVYAFLRGRDWIRLPAMFYAGMIVESVILYLGVGLFGDARLFREACGPAGGGFDYRILNPAKVLAFNLPYLIVPLLLVARLWRPRPFGRGAA